VADAGFMSDKNINPLTDNNIEFIIRGRMKNDTQAIQQQILSLKLANGVRTILSKVDRQCLIPFLSVCGAMINNIEYDIIYFL